MKRALYTYAVFIATLTFMVVSVIPHHHHGGVVYMATEEHCIQDDDLYGGHAPDTHQHCCRDLCFAGSDSSSHIQKFTLTKTGFSDHAGFPLPALFATIAVGLPDPYRLQERREQPPYHANYRSADRFRHLTLRAPPYVFS